MFGIGMTEVAIILLVALVFIGPDKLPKVARTIGKGMRELRRASDDIRSTIMLDDDDDDRYRRTPPPRRVNEALPSNEPSSATIAGSLVAGGQVDDAEFSVVDDLQGEREGESSASAMTQRVSRGGSSAAVTDEGKSARITAPKSDAEDAEDDHAGMPGLDESGLALAKEAAKNGAPKVDVKEPA